ncbi:MAG: DUF3261 domain-containing protein [Candidatus Tectimicrobiota bacterium]
MQCPPVPRTDAVPHYPLLPPRSYGGTVVIEQLLEGWARGEHFQLYSQIDINPQHIVVLGLTAFHVKVFLLRYDGKTLEFENFTDRQLPFAPALILSDIQKIFWPTLPGQGDWRIIDDAGQRVRYVFYAERLMTRIQYQGALSGPGEIELVDLHFGYRLQIQTLTVSST